MDTPTWDSTEAIEQPAQPAMAQQPLVQPQVESNPGEPTWDNTVDTSEYETTGQQIKAGLEGVAEGFAGPLAPLVETKLLGVKPEDILARKEINPVTHGIGQATGIGASLFTGVGEAALAAKAGAQTLEAIGIGSKALEGAGLLSKIGAEAIDQATQMAIIQGGDEVSKLIINDPEATAQNAIANIGLSTAIGGTVGAGIGAISPLFKAAVAEPTAKLLGEMKARWNFRQGVGDVVETAGKEFQELHAANQDLRRMLYSDEGGGLKGELISKAMPEVSEKATVAVQQEAQKVSDSLSKAIEMAQKDSKLRSSVGYLEQDLKNFQEAVTKPDATYANTFDAINDLKRTLQGYSKYKEGVAETALGDVSKKVAAELKPMLENEQVWGKAANIQKEINEYISKHIPAEKDIASKFMTKIGGEQVFDPTKMNTYFNQVGKPNAEIRQEMVKRYLDSSEQMADGINKILANHGLDPQAKVVSTNVLRDSIGEKTAGAKLMDELINKSGAEVLGKGAAAATGAAVAGPVGAVIGEYALGNAFTKVAKGLTKFLVEGTPSATGFKSAVDFTIQAVKGETALNKAVGSVFKAVGTAGTMAVNTPSAEDRAKLDKVVTKFQDNPSMLTKVDHGNTAHYMPNHQTALSETTARSMQYLQQLKPHAFRSSPLDKEIEPSDIEKARYDRALNIAQSPMVVLSHIKDGTLQASDVQDLQSMYPALYRQMTMKLANEVTSMQGADINVPYKTRVSLSLFMGQALDSTMQPASIQAAHMALQAKAQQLNQGPPPGASQQTSKLGKNVKSYQTPLQASQQRNLTHK